MIRPRHIVIVWMPLALVLGGCGESPQVAVGVRSDSPAFQGGSAQAFTASGWKPGDRNSWEQQLKVRAQNGQNDYAKVN